MRFNPYPVNSSSVGRPDYPVPDKRLELFIAHSSRSQRTICHYIVKRLPTLELKHKQETGVTGYSYHPVHHDHQFLGCLSTSWFGAVWPTHWDGISESELSPSEDPVMIWKAKSRYIRKRCETLAEAVSTVSRIGESKSHWFFIHYFGRKREDNRMTWVSLSLRESWVTATTFMPKF
jgi:hypothetical protein